MAKTARSPGKSKAKSTKPKGRRTAKPVQSAKSATSKSGKSPRAKKATAKKSTKARPRATNKPTRSAAKAPVKRSSVKSRKQKPVDVVATFDGWCKQCTAKLRELVHEYSAKTAKSSRAHKHESTPEWLASGARQIGLGLRRGAKLADPRKLIKETGQRIRHIKFDRMTDFCKKEWQELSALASKFNETANPRQSRPTKRAKK